jgi:hypothetical protein
MALGPLDPSYFMYLRVCPETLSRIAELSQHEADRCELEEGEGVAG